MRVKNYITFAAFALLLHLKGFGMAEPKALLEGYLQTMYGKSPGFQIEVTTKIPAHVSLLEDGFMYETQKRKIKIDFYEQGFFPEILLDSVKIKLAIQNLIDNAIKYSQENSKIEISLISNENNIEFKIKDFGMGIPSNQQDKIFTKFFRGDNATKLREIGSGLGLFLCKNIIDAHGGKIWFESKENLETSFYFTLPIK